MDFEKARFNMVEQQIRTWEVLDQAVLDLLFTVKREDFVPLAYRAIAFTDLEIPLGHGQAMMAPKLEARILQELDVHSGDRVLEIGTGSGYLTALLAKRAAHVTSIEIFDDFSHSAGQRLTQAGIVNTRLVAGDAAQSATALIPSGSLFDVIVLTGSVPAVPPAYLDALSPNGRLFAVLGDAPVMEATIVTKIGDMQFATVGLFETVVTPLIHATQPSRFTF